MSANGEPSAVTATAPPPVEQATPAGPSPSVGFQTRLHPDKDAVPSCPPEECDLAHLVGAFLLSVRRGQPSALQSFKSAWVGLHFSHIFHACRHGSYEANVQQLYDIPLEFMVTGLPPRAVRNAFTPSMPQEAGPSAGTPGPGVLPSVASADEVTWLCSIGGQELACACVYSLYCLYHAQPGKPTVKIRLAKEHQTALLKAADLTRGTDAAELLRSLIIDGAIVLGATNRPSSSSRAAADFGAAATLAPGAGVLGLTPGITPEDAALLREVKFHVDSTLSGLGTGHLHALCSRYRQSLQHVLQALSGGSVGLSSKVDGIWVADLEVGRVVHQLAVNKQIDVRNTMLHGPTMQPRSRNRKQRPTAAEPSTAAKSESGQINRVMEVVERKIAARQADIESKRHKWAVLMGLEQEGPPVGASAVAPGLLGPGLDTGEDSDEDMPLIPGLPSMFTHLTGPSAGGRTHSGTEATEVTVQGTGEIELSSKQQNQAPKRKRGASRPPLPPKRGRKAASSDSDDSDNNGRRGASDDWDIIAARERSAMMATLAAHASAEDEDYDAEGAEGSPGGAFYGLEATMAALAEDEGI